ncbi:NDP-hexose 2,3-dehydratase family protein [Polymorphospora sp. NPDC051019]|uniref:NDP-hexose 2,3-dehydratase family protein n=1 Tax=Polymorphospora sp. NPDC051019 TaxID=3155725 RepID=UPI0034238B6D
MPTTPGGTPLRAATISLPRPPTHDSRQAPFIRSHPDSPSRTRGIRNGTPQRERKPAECSHRNGAAMVTAGVPRTRARPEELWPAGVDDGFAAWFTDRAAATSCQVTRVPLDRLRGWSFDPATGDLKHDSGRFFVIEGLHIRSTYGAVDEWYQPVINQPEIGILGMLVKMVDGVPHCLIQAKAEPGNSRMLQLSPTVQATRSNYTRVHRGARTRYLEYFVNPGTGRVLVDVLQSEQGSWFLRKRNRNMVVLVGDDVPASDQHRWVALHELRRLLRVDGLVNMDARTVLSCLPPTFFPGSRGEPLDEDVAGALIRSVRGWGPVRHDDRSVLSWFTRSKCRHELTAERVPLRGLPGWRYRPQEIVREDGRHFSVVGVDVRMDNREVTRWNQPLLYPHGRGVVAFLVKRIDDVAHLLVQARFQAGLIDAMEMGPTVQCVPQSQPGPLPPFVDQVLTAPPQRVLFDALLAEEGGRFYHTENRYMVVEAGDDVPSEEPEGFRWVTVHQLSMLLRHGYYLNVEARSLLACIHALW